jgi:putative acetyltransferase
VILRHQNYVARPWKPEDRDTVPLIVETCLAEYGVSFDKYDVDFRDAVEVEKYFWNKTGELWVCEDLKTGMVVGTAGYYAIQRGSEVAEIRKLYLLPSARGKGFGRALLETLERRIKNRGFTKICVQTITCLEEACKLYQSAGYREAGIPLESVRANLFLEKSVTNS